VTWHVTVTHTVVITIGRKIGAKEMDATKWADFKATGCVVTLGTDHLVFPSV
jgi:hypothetical protein